MARLEFLTARETHSSPAEYEYAWECDACQIRTDCDFDGRDDLCPTCVATFAADADDIITEHSQEQAV